MSTALAQMKIIKERLFQHKRQHFGEDLCDLIGPVFTEGGSGGDSVVLTTVATGIECFVKEISQGKPQETMGGESVVASHRIEMKVLSPTVAITPEYRIRVYARDGKSERVFEKPVQNAASFAPLVILEATLVKQGSQ